ncbi:hypothetical protein GCM10025777_31680 [Membranihabitans marinus]|uniref:Uncharacterized protein n=1 Tax=Nesterenkonia rhizosphaerae TaxID=1348272 RepID=A0ABP9FST1_9MICC
MRIFRKKKTPKINRNLIELRLLLPTYEYNTLISEAARRSDDNWLRIEPEIIAQEAISNYLTRVVISRQQLPNVQEAVI